MSLNLPDLPNTKATNFLERVRETLQTITGRNDPEDRLVTVGDLVDSGMVKVNDGYIKPPGGGGGGTGPPPIEPIEPEFPVYVPDLSVPPTPTGVILTSGLTALFIETDPPAFAAGHGYLRTLVYGERYSGTGPLPTYTEGVTDILTEFQGEVGTYNVDPNEQWHLWLKWVSVDGVASLVSGGTNGHTTTSTQTDATHIGDATITNAKIVTLAVGKLTAGSIAAGQYIRSSNYVPDVAGFNIPATGFAEFSDVVIRGTVHAQTGTIGGSVIGLNFMQSTNYIADAAGWRLMSDGTGQLGGFKMLSTGIQSQNYAAGSSGWRLGYDGTGQIAGITMNLGSMQSSNYVAGSAGWRLDAAGTGQIGGMAVTTTALQSNNYSAGGEGFQFRFDGTGQLGGFVVTSTAIHSVNWNGSQGWYIGKDGTANFSRLAIYGVVYGSVYVPNNETAYFIHGTGRHIILTPWSAEGNVAIVLLDVTSCHFRLDNSPGGTVYYAYV